MCTLREDAIHVNYARACPEVTWRFFFQQWLQNQLIIFLFLPTVTDELCYYQCWLGNPA